MANKITVAEPEDTDSEYLICVPISDPLALPDNVTGICNKCGKGIQFRPHAFDGLEKICLPCAMPMMTKEAAKGELEIVISPETMEEIKEHNRKKKLN